MFRDTDRQIVGARNGRVFKMGQRVHVLLDRIDRQQRRLQFALLPSEEELVGAPRSLRRSKTAATSAMGSVRIRVRIVRAKKGRRSPRRETEIRSPRASGVSLLESRRRRTEPVSNRQNGHDQELHSSADGVGPSGERSCSQQS